MISIMLVDDHELVRTGLRTSLELEDDLKVVAEAGTGEEALDRLKVTEVDVVLMDVMMPGKGGIEACREIRETGETPRVLMLTSSSDEDAVLSSLIAGASGYLLKNVGSAELVRSVRLVAEGKTTLDPAVTAKVTAQLVKLSSGKAPGSDKTTSSADVLSEREMEVVGCVAEGLTNRQIAERLVIAEKTARNHVSRILEKLGLTRRSQAAAWAMKEGLVE